jgi:hypothetical protein
MLRGVASMLLPGDKQLEVRTIDIGDGGVGIVSPASPPIGMACGLRLTIPARSSGPVVLEVRVKVWQSMLSAKDHGFKVGLGFVDLTRQQERTIRGYLES